MNANDSVVVDYMQLEGGTFMTSPIFTTGVASSRGTDFTAIFNPTFDQFFNQREGTFYAEFDILGEAGSTDNQVMVSVGTSNNNSFSDFFRLDERNFVGFYNPPAGGVGYDDATNRAFKGVTVYGRKAHGALNTTGINKALYNPNVSGGINLYVNTPYDRLGIGFQIRTISNYRWMHGRIKRIIYIPYFINNETDLTLIGDR
jgi:hypothetical protein